MAWMLLRAAAVYSTETWTRLAPAVQDHVEVLPIPATITSVSAEAIDRARPAPRRLVVGRFGTTAITSTAAPAILPGFFGTRRAGTLSATAVKLRARCRPGPQPRRYAGRLDGDKAAAVLRAAICWRSRIPRRHHADLDDGGLTTWCRDHQIRRSRGAIEWRGGAGRMRRHSWNR